MLTEKICYHHQKVTLEAFSTYPKNKKSPAIILCHAWRGRDEYICEKAHLMAEWGYVGFALDMYGKGVLGNSKEENAALKAPFIKDRMLLQERLLSAWEVILKLPYVDATRIAVLGFGFGGLCALDFARSGVSIRSAISVYGHYEMPEGVPVKPIKAKVMVLHGYNDPIVSLNELQAFEKEMTSKQVDWRTHIFSNSMHAFTNPQANDPRFGTVYNPQAALRAWREIKTFLTMEL